MAKLTKKTTVYLAALTLSGMALAADRMLSASPATGPAEAAASLAVPASERSVPPSPASSIVETLPGLSGATRISVAEQLRTAEQSRKLTPADDLDIFRPSADWLAAAIPPEKPSAQATPRPSPSTDFAARHRLTGLMAAGQQSVAIVNGQTLRAGADIDGFRLVALGPRSAVFEADDGSRVTLSMEGPVSSSMERPVR